MRKLLFAVVLVILLPVLGRATEAETRKIMIFPFKVVEKGQEPRPSIETAAVLGGELVKEGDVQVSDSASLGSVIQTGTPDPARMARLASRMDLFAIIWGTLTKLEDGYSLEVSVMGKNEREKPRLFTATGKGMEELVSGIKEMAGEIGQVVLHRPRVGSIKIEGNKRIQKETILNKLGMKEGVAFNRSALGENIRELYSMGYFDDVQISADETAEGAVDLRIVLKERPSVKEIQTEGNKLLTKEEILDALTTKSFAVVNPEKIRDDIVKMKKMYEKKGYYEPKIDYEIKELSRNEAKLVFKIDEGQKSWLTRVVLEGAKQIPEKELKKVLGTKEKSWFWFLDESGTFTSEELEKNRLRLMAQYWLKGFVNVQVGAPRVDIKAGSVTVTYPIREGERYQVRKVEVTGDLLESADKVTGLLKTKPRTWFNRQDLADDIQTLTRLYNNAGYAYADVAPLQTGNDEHHFLDLNFKVTKGERVTIEKVDIRGNERTRGKVIRRVLAIGEGDVYNSDLVEISKKNVEGMEFFEAVKIKTSPGSRPELMNLTVEVMEKKTGSLTTGVSYSSSDGVTGTVDLKERNLLGLGVVANVSGNISGRRSNGELSMTYPWAFDIPLSVTGRLYRQQQKEDRYLRDGEGFGLTTGYPIYGFWGLTAGFARDSYKISGIEKIYARSVTDYYAKYGVRAESFLNLSENSLSLWLRRDTRYGSPLPVGGMNLVLGSRISGFGSDVQFSRHFTEFAYYQPLYWRLVMKVQANGSALVESGGAPIPIDRRIILGGPNSIRGYQQGEIGPRDRYGSVLGGDRALYTNVECLFPLLEGLKLNGVVFFDVGNAWDADHSPLPTEVKAAGGLGVRWLSPMGPIRMEYGWKVRPQKGEAPGALTFAMGQLF